jgi:hypothetical protein
MTRGSAVIAAALLLWASGSLGCSDEGGGASPPGGTDAAVDAANETGGGSDAAKDTGGDSDVNCEGRGDRYFAGLKKASADGLVNVEITSADPAPPGLGDRNTLILKVTDSQGNPIEKATLVCAPWMPDHDHGSAAQVATEIGGGAYNLTGLNFRMNGLWQATVRVERTPGTPESSVPFEFCIRAR